MFNIHNNTEERIGIGKGLETLGWGKHGFIKKTLNHKFLEKNPIK
jgi:hypothetical protein